MTEPNGGQTSIDRRAPIPDPTSLTTEQLDKAIRSLHEYLESRIVGVERAVEVASEEREKSAQALRVQLSHEIASGDAALREHIEQQVKQLSIMLDAGRREVDVRAEAERKAIEKSEVSYDKRFAGVNELRKQMQDLIASHQKTVHDLTATLMPREVAESKFADLERVNRAVTSRLDQAGGKELGTEKQEAKQQFSTTTGVALVMAAVAIIGLIVVLANGVTAA